MSPFNDCDPYGLGAYAQHSMGEPYWWRRTYAPALQNQLAALQNLGMRGMTGEQKAQQRRESACRWFATHYRARAAESGIQAVARQMRKQGVPVDIAVSILATR